MPDSQCNIKDEHIGTSSHWMFSAIDVLVAWNGRGLSKSLSVYLVRQHQVSANTEVHLTHCCGLGEYAIERSPRYEVAGSGVKNQETLVLNLALNREEHCRQGHVEMIIDSLRGAGEARVSCSARYLTSSGVQQTSKQDVRAPP